MRYKGTHDCSANESNARMRLKSRFCKSYRQQLQVRWLHLQTRGLKWCCQKYLAIYSKLAALYKLLNYFPKILFDLEPEHLGPFSPHLSDITGTIDAFKGVHFADYLLKLRERGGFFGSILDQAYQSKYTVPYNGDFATIYSLTCVMGKIVTSDNESL
uniref:Uncharacterized protein n=1 Tax=Echinococcus canadensis TaxID=519352 RepID=A0A915EVN3_9CEST